LKQASPVATVKADILKRGVLPERLIAAAIVLGSGLALASCGGPSQFSDYVADHWPHWAGGLPPDVPPRPGAPGYEDFVAHGQVRPAETPAAPRGAAPSDHAARTGKPNPVFRQTPAAATPARQTPAAATPARQTVPEAPAAPETPVAEQPADDASVVRGGLY
jgi:hypothetical protein